MISPEKIKELRFQTGISVMECKRALEEAKGDLEKAKEILKRKGLKIAESKSQREVKAGLIASYLHPNHRVGVLLDLRCETDFVAKSADFTDLSHELCLQVAAMAPQFISVDKIPSEILKKEEKIFKEQLADSDKPQKVIEGIIEGKLGKLKQEITLLNQAYIKEPDKTIGALIEEYIAKLGENIVIERFVRYEI